MLARRAGHGRSSWASAKDTDVIWIEIGMMLIILSIACINFTTLSIARSTGRSLEVGIRKVLGARRVNVVCQFWAKVWGQPC